ncbi:hypothetical protein Pd630_LPD09175 (plasmid) [Rhodococcus opacus PD630]|nr:hypothetical protein Pd630_LPD09175 [Rhodococcus opacus PD630]
MRYLDVLTRGCRTEPTLPHRPRRRGCSPPGRRAASGTGTGSRYRRGRSVIASVIAVASVGLLIIVG